MAARVGPPLLYLCPLQHLPVEGEHIFVAMFVYATDLPGIARCLQQRFLLDVFVCMAIPENRLVLAHAYMHLYCIFREMLV